MAPLLAACHRPVAELGVAPTKPPSPPQQQQMPCVPLQAVLPWGHGLPVVLQVLQARHAPLAPVLHQVWPLQGALLGPATRPLPQVPLLPPVRRLLLQLQARGQARGQPQGEACCQECWPNRCQSCGHLQQEEVSRIVGTRIETSKKRLFQVAGKDTLTDTTSHCLQLPGSTCPSMSLYARRRSASQAKRTRP